MTFSRKDSKATQPQEHSRAALREAPTQDAAEFEALFQQHWSRLCNMLFRVVGDWHEAEDLALDAFWRLYRQPPHDEHNLAGWLYRVGANLGFNALRARKRRQHYEEESGYLALTETSPGNPLQEVEQAQERQCVRDVLAEMKPRSAEILTLRHSGFSYTEIAQALGISPGSVGTLLARAEQEFERAYQKESERQ